jgi:argininosuccinate lyase
VHTALESRLTSNVGDAGARLHLGRSRNDQVLTALRLYLREAANDLSGRIGNLRAAVEKLGQRQGDVQLPGYTHMQHAMPSTVALWCGGFDEAFADAQAGLKSVQRRISKNPLGSAAGYGTPGLPLDREMTTGKLAFEVTQSPVTSVQLSRGKAESTLLFEITLLLGDISRMATDLLLFYTQEFAYISLAPEVTTGSSIMPQKRNPDVLELLRAASSTAHACLDESLMITAKLQSGYQRDLQRLKAPLFRGIDLAVDSVDIMAYVLDGLAFQPDNIELDDGIFATEEAYRLVRDEGIPFRTAYQQVAKRYSK